MFKYNQLLDRDLISRPQWTVQSDKWFATGLFPENDVKTDWAEKMTLTVPLTEPGNLKVTVKNRTLILNGQNETENMQNGATVKSINQWSRHLTIPDKIDAKSIEVELNNTKLVIKSKMKETCTSIPVIFE